MTPYSPENRGARASQPPPFQSSRRPPELPPGFEIHEPSHGSDSHHVAARGFGQLYGLHPIPALTTFVANEMLFGGMVITMGALFPLALGVAIVLGIITYKAQRSMYGDDHDAALVKSLAVGLITCIPVGLPAFLTVPSGVVGLVHTLRRRP
jgi:hypothetical protein